MSAVSLLSYVYIEAHTTGLCEPKLRPAGSIYSTTTLNVVVNPLSQLSRQREFNSDGVIELLEVDSKITYWKTMASWFVGSAGSIKTWHIFSELKKRIKLFSSATIGLLDAGTDEVTTWKSMEDNMTPLHISVQTSSNLTLIKKLLSTRHEGYSGPISDLYPGPDYTNEFGISSTSHLFKIKSFLSTIPANQIEVQSPSSVLNRFRSLRSDSPVNEIFVKAEPLASLTLPVAMLSNEGLAGVPPNAIYLDATPAELAGKRAKYLLSEEPVVGDANNISIVAVSALSAYRRRPLESNIGIPETPGIKQGTIFVTTSADLNFFPADIDVLNVEVLNEQVIPTDDAVDAVVSELIFNNIAGDGSGSINGTSAELIFSAPLDNLLLNEVTTELVFSEPSSVPGGVF